MERSRRDRDFSRGRDRDSRRPRRRESRDRDFESDFGNFNRRDSDRPSFRKEMHTAICAKCGKECQVPFKPSSDKPVYCDACFSKKDSPKREDNLKKELDEINKKLDKILKIIMD